MSEPAFPSHGTMGEVVHEGMTLEDYFAAAALTGIMAWISKASEASGTNLGDQTARMAYDLAADMIAEREKRQK